MNELPDTFVSVELFQKNTWGMFNDPRLPPRLELINLLRLCKLHIRWEAGRADSWAQAAKAAARREDPMGRLVIRAAEKK